MKFFIIPFFIIICSISFAVNEIEKGSRLKISVGIVEVSHGLGGSSDLTVSQESIDAGDTVQDISITLPSLASSAGDLGIIEGSFLIGDNMWDFVLSSIMREGEGRIISNTFGVTDDGKTLNFNAFSKEPYQTLKVIGNKEQLVVEFLNIGTEAKVTPTIIEGGKISVSLDFRISEILRESDEESEISVPIESERRIQTDVTVTPTELIVLGGLDQEKRTKVKSGFPFLRNIPIIGFLFSSKEDKISKTKLYVIAQVEPVPSTDVKKYELLKQENEDKIKRKGLDKLR